MSYIFDTNIFIRSKNDMPINLWPSFWNKLQQMVNDGCIYSCSKVKEEIERGNDELTKWIKDNAPASFFIGADTEVLSQLRETQNWANSNPIFRPTARNNYADAADAYLVATAKAKHLTLVTYETSDPTCQKRVKIPDACDALGVRYCDLNTVLRELNITI